MLKLYNTLSRRKEEFKPQEGKSVGIYSCGPTVYDFAHVGNLRAYIFVDILKRAIEHEGFNVKHIMNITDVGHLVGDQDMGDDKIEKAAATERKTAWEIASYYTDAFLNDLRELNIKFPDKFPKATDHVKEMIALIGELEKKGFTYQTRDGIYFDTSKLPDYGKLAKLDIEGLREGARVEPNPEKKNPTDFALWKLSIPGGHRQMEWQSPWGVGFPGWHIECSAMSRRYLGQPFDIHTGGVDHIPLHHTNEIAQSEAAYGVPLANYWLHSEFVLINQGRMGKSEGNLITLQQLKDKGYSPFAYRYFVLQGHYRSKLNFTWEALESAQNTLNNLYSEITDYQAPKIGCAEYEKHFFERINDDLDTPGALATMWELIKSDYPGEAKLESLFLFDKIWGLSLRETWEELQQPLPKEIEKLIQKRDELRAEQKWQEADEIRKQIEAQGFEVKDAQTKTIVKRKV